MKTENKSDESNKTQTSINDSPVAMGHPLPVRSKSWQEGYQAYLDYLRLEDNKYVYSEGAYDWHQWNEGWRYAAGND